MEFRGGLEYDMMFNGELKTKVNCISRIQTHTHVETDKLRDSFRDTTCLNSYFL